MPARDGTGWEIDRKVVFAGPSGSGKSTTIRAIHAELDPVTRGPLLAPARPDGSTLFFDLVTVELGSIDGRGIRLQLLSGPGDAERAELSRTVLRGADGIVFVADSSADRLDANRDSLATLQQDLAQLGVRSLPPFAFQYNKRDLPDALAVEELDRILNPDRAPSFATVATRREGVVEPLVAVSERLVRALT